jgi:hypothetical protein
MNPRSRARLVEGVIAHRKQVEEEKESLLKGVERLRAENARLARERDALRRHAGWWQLIVDAVSHGTPAEEVLQRVTMLHESEPQPAGPVPVHIIPFARRKR